MILRFLTTVVLCLMTSVAYGDDLQENKHWSVFTRCGVYNVKGSLHCKRPKCELILFENSRSELKIVIKRNLLAYERSKAKYIETDVEITRLSPIRASVGSTFRPTLLTRSSKDALLKKELACRQ